jgi:hypothetical protein
VKFKRSSNQGGYKGRLQSEAGYSQTQSRLLAGYRKAPMNIREQYIGYKFVFKAEKLHRLTELLMFESEEIGETK